MKSLSFFTLFLITSFFIFTASSCLVSTGNTESEEPEIETLPELTTTGAHTLGCLVNGEVWLPTEKKPFTSRLYSVSYNTSNGGLSVNGERMYKDEDSWFAFSMIVLDTGIFTLNENMEQQEVFYDFTKSGGADCMDFYTGWKDTQVEIVRLDEVERIISGRFEFSMCTNLCGDTLQITDGVFDIKF